ncbi:hypothetical protein CEXT_780381 [Caerostris extrusa]|uniref:Uncharacterized protein n=1 Tax=Caerostris extrusa TaxID=172846 RepID=A0AAV4RM56_CAEEX|nr:hypothetical protein CEXT_780381 [Caerostris extrusa]
MTPDPIRLSAKQIEVTAEGEIQEDIPSGARIQVKIWKVIPFFGWKLPAPFCVLPMGCDVEHCSFLDKFSQPETNSTQSVCPVEAQTFNSTRTIDMPSLGGLTKFLVSVKVVVFFSFTSFRNLVHVGEAQSFRVEENSSHPHPIFTFVHNATVLAKKYATKWTYFRKEKSGYAL